jgi:hypothetical protein
MDVSMGSGFKQPKPFKLNLYKDTQILSFIDESGNPNAKLVILEEFSDEFEDRWFCFFVVNDEKEIPEGAKYIDICKGKYWTPFALFEVTGCDLNELE